MTLAEPFTGSLSADQIRSALPHRHPFALLDRVTRLEPGRRGTGVKNVTVAEPCFAGHFPERYVFPGVLLVEALAQLAGIVHGSGRLLPAPDGAARIGYLAAVRNFKFTRPVRPGDQVRLDVEAGSTLGALSDFTATASVDGEVAATGRLVIADSPEESHHAE